MKEPNLKPKKPTENSDNEDQIQNALEVSQEAIASMRDYIKNIVQDFRKNEEREANAKLSELIEIVNLFVQLISQVKEKSPNISIVEEKIDPIERHLLETVKEILEVKQNADDTSLCDLLEYELEDNLERWQIQIITPLLT